VEAVTVRLLIAPEQIVEGVAILVATGGGFTVTVMVNGALVQECVVSVAVTRYCTVPVEEPGLVSVWLMVEPELALAPVMPPVMVPIVHEKVLGKFAARLIFVAVPVQMFAVLGVVMEGAGFTVIVMVEGVPAQEPDVAVGVTMYCTVPAVLPGLVSTWLMVEPEPLLAPVIPPVIVPIVHEKELGALAVKLRFGPVPLQIVAAVVEVMTGAGLTVTVMVNGLPTQEPVVDVGVTIY
jgi:hypothetical protein